MFGGFVAFRGVSWRFVAFRGSAVVVSVVVLVVSVNAGGGAHGGFCGGVCGRWRRRADGRCVIHG